MDCIDYAFIPGLNNYSGSVQVRIKDHVCIPIGSGPCLLNCGNIVSNKICIQTGVNPQFKKGFNNKSLSEEEFNEWIKTLIKLFPQVEQINLFGSRNEKTNRPNSDWDVLITLSDSCYINDNPNPKNDVERWIMNTRELTDHCVDIYFLRPNKLIARYNKQYINESIFKIKGFREKDPAFPSGIKDPALKKQLGSCNWDKLYESVKNSTILYKSI